MSQGVDVNPDESMPNDPYLLKRKELLGNTTRITPKIDDKLRRLLEFDGKVLRFYAAWDNRDAPEGELSPYIIHYFLVDDNIEICECEDFTNKKVTVMLSKMKIPKNWKSVPVHYPSVYLERTDEEVVEYYQPKDFLIGNTVFLLGRRFLILDCDKFTRKYYSHCLQIEQGEAIPPDKEKAKPKREQELPPYLGLGSVEDSIQSFYHFNPKPPKLDLIRYLYNMNKKLRYTAVMEIVHPEDEIREFIIEYRLSDGTIMIHENRKRNSGFSGGKFLKNILLPKPRTDPNNPEYYTPADFDIGSIITVFGHKFRITGVDMGVYNYMEANPEKFKPEVLANVRKFLVREGYLNEAIKDIADFQISNALLEPNTDNKQEHPLNALQSSQPPPSATCALPQKSNPIVSKKQSLES